MKLYHQMKKTDVIDSLTIINEFSQNFPMMKLQDINFHELAKFYHRNHKDLISMICFLDCINQINEHPESKQPIFIDIQQVSKIKIKKNQNQWIFFIYKNAESYVELVHNFKI